MEVPREIIKKFEMKVNLCAPLGWRFSGLLNVIIGPDRGSKTVLEVRISSGLEEHTDGKGP